MDFGVSRRRNSAYLIYRDAVSALVAGGRRTLLGMLGALIGVLGLMLAGSYGTASEDNINRDLARIDGTRIVVTTTESVTISAAFRERSIEFIRGLPGVTSAGLVIPAGSVSVANPASSADPEAATAYSVDAGAATALGIDAATRSSWFGTWSRHPVIVGVGLAKSINLAHRWTSPSLTVDRIRRPVLGVVSRAPGMPELTRAVILPVCCGRAAVAAEKASLFVQTVSGVTDAVADRLPQILAPGNPDSITVSVESSPRRLRSQVSSAFQSASAAIAVAALILGGLLNAFLRLMAVQERRAELGLRMALGATRRDVVVQVASESVLLAACGSLIGFSVGAAISIAEGAIVDAQTAAISLLVGIGSGSVAALLPAVAVSRIHPAEALRT